MNDAYSRCPTCGKWSSTVFKCTKCGWQWHGKSESGKMGIAWGDVRGNIEGWMCPSCDEVYDMRKFKCTKCGWHGREENVCYIDYGRDKEVLSWVCPCGAKYVLGKRCGDEHICRTCAHWADSERCWELYVDNDQLGTQHGGNRRHPYVPAHFGCNLWEKKPRGKFSHHGKTIMFGGKDKIEYHRYENMDRLVRWLGELWQNERE